MNGRLKKRRCVGITLIAAGSLAASLVRHAESSQPDSAQRDTASKSAFLTGRPFEEALNQPVSISWQERRLRSGLRQLSRSREVAILLDRRIDPEQPMTLGLSRLPLRDILRTIATECDAGVSIVGSTVYVGPVETAAKLRTIVELRSTELAVGVDTKRSFQLLRRETLHWQDLDRPSDIFAAVCRRADLQVAASGDGVKAAGKKVSLLPHDLWAAGSIPNATVPEKLTLILAQFDLCFQWQKGAGGVQLIPVPRSPVVPRTWTGLTRERRTRISERLPQLRRLNARLNGTRLTATGTVEQLEEVDRLLYSERYPGVTPETARGDLQFTLEVRAQLGSLLTALPMKSDIEFRFDAAALKAAGVDLTRVVEMKMNKATLAELCETMFKDSGLLWKIDGNAVTLRAK